jgi:hypothetical protein
VTHRFPLQSALSALVFFFSLLPTAPRAAATIAIARSVLVEKKLKR